MRIIVKLLLSAVAVIATAYVLPNVHVDSFVTAVLVAAVLSLFQIFLKPVLVILTIPVTILTLGLFLWVINAALTLLAANFIDGFQVDGFWWAVIFSFILAVLVSILHKIVPDGERDS
ncbi:MAG: membrane protein [Cyclobacteriaceae bacterium]|nr:MAG: membrane protein [Cyclobacteriaceae bacterium]